MEIRELTPDDAPAIVTMSRDAFGGPLPPPDAMQWHDGMLRWGVFDGGTLVAKLNDRDYASGIRGRDVRTAGIAAVVVAPEYRGRGLGGTADDACDARGPRAWRADLHAVPHGARACTAAWATSRWRSRSPASSRRRR